MALALGLVTCIARSGTVLNFVIAAPVFNLTKSLAISFWVGTFLMEISVIMGLITLLIDQYVSKKTHYNPEHAKTSKIALSDLKKLSGKFWLIVFSLIGFYIGFLCFVNISVEFAKTKFYISDTNAGMLAVILKLT